MCCVFDWFRITILSMRLALYPVGRLWYWKHKLIWVVRFSNIGFCICLKHILYKSCRCKLNSGYFSVFTGWMIECVRLRLSESKQIRHTPHINFNSSPVVSCRRGATCQPLRCIILKFLLWNLRTMHDGDNWKYYVKSTMKWRIDKSDYPTLNFMCGLHGNRFIIIWYTVSSPRDDWSFETV